MTDTILLPVDGSDGTDGQVERALDLAESAGATVHALFVVNTGRYGEPALSSAEVLVDDMEDEGNALLAEVAARGRARGVEVVTRCCHGRPNDALVEHAGETGADVVVLGPGRHPRKTLRALERVVDRIERPTTLTA